MRGMLQQRIARLLQLSETIGLDHLLQRISAGAVDHVLQEHGDEILDFYVSEPESDRSKIIEALTDRADILMRLERRSDYV